MMHIWCTLVIYFNIYLKKSFFEVCICIENDDWQSWLEWSYIQGENTSYSFKYNEINNNKGQRVIEMQDIL